MKTLLLATLILLISGVAEAQPPRTGPMKSVYRLLPKYFKSDTTIHPQARRGDLSMELKNYSATDTLFFQLCVTLADTATVAAEGMDGYGRLDPGETKSFYYKEASRVKWLVFKRSGNDSTHYYRMLQQ